MKPNKLNRFVLSKPFQPGLTFVGKAPELGSGLVRKHLTRLERPAKDKHSSLLQKFIDESSLTFGGKAPKKCST
jgi:hypothetical protein